MELNIKKKNETKSIKEKELYNLLNEIGFLNFIMDKSEEEIKEINKVIVNSVINLK